MCTYKCTFSISFFLKYSIANWMFFYFSVVKNQAKHKYLPELQSVNRITNIPIIETGWTYAGNIYNKIKVSHAFFISFHSFVTPVFWAKKLNDRSKHCQTNEHQINKVCDNLVVISFKVTNICFENGVTEMFAKIIRNLFNLHFKYPAMVECCLFFFH